DQLTRRPGGVLLLDVRYKGKSAGRMLIAAKPRAAWKQAFVTKLRQEQSEAGADHAILATAVFPAGKKEMFVDAGVIVVAPARVRQVLRDIDTDVSAIVESRDEQETGRVAAFRVGPR